MNCFQIYEQAFNVDIKKQKRNQKIKFYFFFSAFLLIFITYISKINYFFSKFITENNIYNIIKNIFIPGVFLLIVILIVLVISKSKSYENHFVIRQNIRVALRKFYIEIISNNTFENIQYINFVINQFKREIQLNDKKTNQLAHEEFILFVEKLQKKREKLNFEHLQHIYHEFGFYESTISMAKSTKWHIKTKAFYNLQLLRFENSLYLIKPYINDKNKKLALSAFLSYVILSKDGDIIKKTYDKSLNVEMPLATKIKVTNVLLSYNISSFNFTDFIESENSNILLIAIFYATKKCISLDIKTIKKILKSEDALVRKEIYQHVRVLKINDVAELLISNYETETERNQISILKTLEALNCLEEVNFLTTKKLNETKPEKNYYIIKTLSKINVNCIETIKSNNNKIIDFQINDILREINFKQNQITNQYTSKVKKLVTNNVVFNCKPVTFDKNSILVYA